MVALRLVHPEVHLLALEEFERGKRVDREVRNQPDQEEIDLRHEQANGEDAHQAAVRAPELEDDVARRFRVGQVLCLVVLDGVKEEGRERIPEEVVDARRQEAGHGHQPPVVPCVDGQRHDLGCGVRPEAHEVAVKQAYRVERNQHDDQPHHEHRDGHALVVEYPV